MTVENDIAPLRFFLPYSHQAPVGANALPKLVVLQLDDAQPDRQPSPIATALDSIDLMVPSPKP